MRPRILLSLFGVAIVIFACGKKGPPIPPERRLPAAVQDLSTEIQGRQVTLTWTNPRQRADKTPLRDLSVIYVFRRLEAPGAEPRPAVGEGEQVVGFERIAIIELKKEGPEVRVEGRRGQFVDTPERQTGRYTYVVAAVDAERRVSPPSNRVVVSLLAAPLAPSNLRAEAGDGRVRLAWQPPVRNEDGSPVPGPLHYHVFRTTSRDAPRSRPVTLEPLTISEFVDLAVENETTYYYTVRAIYSEAGSQIQSQDSLVVAVKPEDTTPPAPPRNLVAVPAAGGVRLAWEPSPDTDVAGYIVHRSTVSGRDYARLLRTPQPGTTFVDSQVRRGTTYFYVVTAVDRSPRANESVPSAEVRVTVP